MEPNDTRTRILDAAIEAYLEKGVNATTVRDICARAKANVAAVNYHFGSKEALHAAVLEHSMDLCHRRYPVEEGMEACATAQERLCLLIRNMLRLSFPDDPYLERLSQLFWLEVGNPSPEFVPVNERFTRPLVQVLEAIVAEIIGPRADTDTLRLSIAAVVGQCMFHSQNRRFIHMIYPDKTYAPRDVRDLADHACRFALAGLAAVRASLEATP
uniref:TetR/AcrR family transcriptional regulator n=1 Tax=Fundidesulfovibrio putealis TaxID=270496 RepID=A0A7C4AH07_9BACT